MLLHSDERDEAKAVRQKFLAHEAIAKPKQPDAELAPSLPHGLGGGSEHAIAKALSGWSDADSKPSSGDVAKEGQGKAKVAGSNLQAGANLEMMPVNVPFNSLNPQAQSAVEQGGQVVSLFGNSRRIGNTGHGLLPNSTGNEAGTATDHTDEINWAAGSLQENLGQSMGNYGIQTVLNEDGTIVVTSNNIQIQVQNLGAEFDERFAGMTDAEIEELLQQSLDRKDRDDTLAYGQGTDELRQRALDEGYYGSEQHVVWAVSASARTGGRIPPEYFMELDPYGGTAGNGPEILFEGGWGGGGAGGTLSTIAMAHDTDYDIGRHFGVGPLAELHGLEPQTQDQMKLMGTVGLMSANVALMANLGAFGDTAAEPILRAIDANASGDGYYGQGNPAWDVNYTWDYIKAETNAFDGNPVAWWASEDYRFTPDCRDPNAPRRNDLDGMIEEHGHRLPPDDEHESA